MGNISTEGIRNKKKNRHRFWPLLSAIFAFSEINVICKILVLWIGLYTIYEYEYVWTLLSILLFNHTLRMQNTFVLVYIFDILRNVYLIWSLTRTINSFMQNNQLYAKRTYKSSLDFITFLFLLEPTDNIICLFVCVLCVCARAYACDTMTSCHV